MTLIENQTYKKQISYFNNENEEQKVKINISVNFNHEAPNNILQTIEQQLDCLFLTDYISEETHKQKEQLSLMRDQVRIHFLNHKCPCDKIKNNHIWS